ncbi:MAG: nucleoside hydrolase [Acidobacteriota bacterium]|nr:nucleoside hydrolase [Acidobacteriota bacterium]MDH3524478.1 nucleoside hydrolase [Acidobacteriota bacterium]
MRSLRTVGLVLGLASLAVAPAVRADDGRIKVFVDQDTSGPAGTDSISIAMLLQAPNIDVVGIGVVAGDAWLDQAVYHTLKMVELTGQTHVPVAAGSEVPLLNSQGMMERREALWGEKAGDGWHGNWGDEVPPRGEIPLEPGGPTALEVVDKSAAELLIEMARKYPGELVLHTAGPLTNIALAVRLAPDIVDKIKAVYTMGGHIATNQRFNFWWDAEAAFIHLRTPWKERHLTPIDVCHKTYMTRELIEQIASAGTPLAEYLRASYFDLDRGYSYMWDELAAAAIIDPEIITATEELRLDIDYLPGPSYGKTVWTTDRIQPWFSPATWTVQTDIDVERFERLFVDLMRRPPAR